MTVTIWHNPRCSKSRATLAILEDQGVETIVVHYLETPPAADEIKNTLSLLGMQSARELMRKGEEAFKQNNLSDTSLSEEELIAAMISHPKLIERPLVFAAGKAIIGRPPEAVLDIIQTDAS